MHRSPQPTPRSALSEFTVRVIVAGSRDYDDYEFFSKAMFDYVERLRLLHPGESILFISGVAKTGADAMIVRWCKQFGYDWTEFPAEWDNLEAPGAVIRYRRNDNKPYNVKAGYDRNERMAEVATNLMVFWDGISKGTLHMQEVAKKRGITPDTVLIDINKDPSYGRESRSRYGGHSEVR